MFKSTGCVNHWTWTTCVRKISKASEMSCTCTKLDDWIPPCKFWKFGAFSQGGKLCSCGLDKVKKACQDLMLKIPMGIQFFWTGFVCLCIDCKENREQLEAQKRARSGKRDPRPIKCEIWEKIWPQKVLLFRWSIKFFSEEHFRYQEFFKSFWKKTGYFRNCDLRKSGRC